MRHVFAGKTRAEAEGYFDAHLGTDAFLEGGVERAHWKDVDCEVDARWYPPGIPVVG